MLIRAPHPIPFYNDDVSTPLLHVRNRPPSPRTAKGAMEQPPSLTALIRAGDLASLLPRLTDPALPQQLVLSDDEGHTPLHWAALAPAPVLATLLPLAPKLDCRSSNPAQLRQTPLHWACVSAPLQNVRALLDAGADPSFRDANGYDAPTHAAQYGRVAVLHLILSKWPVLARTTDNESHTLLQWAAYYGHHHCVRYLAVVHAVDIDAIDSQGATALHRALQRNHHLVANALVSAGADVSITDVHGNTPYQLAPSQKKHSRSSCSKSRPNQSQDAQSERGRVKYPARYGLVLFYYLMLAISYAKFWQLTIGTGLISLSTLVITHVLLVISVLCHLNTAFGNPGDLTRGTRDTFVRHIQKCVDNDRDIDLLPSAYCYTCLTEKPPRSKHSTERSVCVRMFDHECPWLNNSIGLNTRRQFLLLVLTTPIVQMVFISTVIRVAMASRSIAIFMKSYPMESCLVVIHVVLAVFCIMLFATQIQLVARGRTTYEHIVAMRDGVTSNPYNKGIWQNTVSFLTSTGPGTAAPLLKMNFKTLKDVVFASGKAVLSTERQALSSEEQGLGDQLPPDKV